MKHINYQSHPGFEINQFQHHLIFFEALLNLFENTYMDILWSQQLKHITMIKFFPNEYFKNELKFYHLDLWYNIFKDQFSKIFAEKLYTLR